jgi:PhnB protein
VQLRDGSRTLEIKTILGDSSLDAAMARAEAAGGRVMRPAKDEFYGDRSGMIEDPFGHLWLIQTHIEDVTPEQMKRRMEEVPRSG